MADARDLPFDASLSTGNDGVVIIAEDPDEVARVEARRHPEGRHARRGVALVAEDAEVERLQPPTRRVREVAVTLDNRPLPLFGHQAQRLLQPDEDADGRRGRRRALLERGLVRLQIEVELREVRALIRLPGLLAHRHHGDAGRRAPGLLRRGNEDVDAPLVDHQIDRTRTRHAVDDEELARFADDLGDLLERVQHAGRGLVVGDENGLRAVLALLLRELLADEVGLDGAAPRDIDAAGLDAVRLAHRGEALAERAVHEEEDAVAARERVHDRGFHAPGPRDGEEEDVAFGVEEVLERPGQAGHESGELGPTVVDHRPCRCVEHGLGDKRRTRDPQVLRPIHMTNPLRIKRGKRHQ